MLRTLALVIALAAPAFAEEAAPPNASRRAPPAAGSAAGPRAQDPGGAGEPAGFAPRRPMPPPIKPMTRPAPEIAAAGKDAAGTWTCKGNTQRGDGSSAPLTATVTVKLDLDNAWIATTLVEKTGPLKWTEYRTYDGVAKQWTKLQMANTSGYVVSTSLGEQGGSWTWNGTATSPNGSLQLRDHEQKDGKTIKRWGEAMLGGTWQKVYEVSCKR